MKMLVSMLLLASAAPAVAHVVRRPVLIAGLPLQPLADDIGAMIQMRADELVEISDNSLRELDDVALTGVVRVADHASAVATLSYFGLISMEMMAMRSEGMPATFRAVSTRSVGPVSNARFAAQFPTLVTPANFVFLIWPVIATLQFCTVGLSAFRKSAPLRQSELTSLSLANCFATAWLLISSNAASALPVWSVLTLPLVPIFSGLPLRSSSPPQDQDRLVFDVFSSFTTIASFLAIAVELQHGGRIPFFSGNAEGAAMAFLALTGGLVSLPRRTTPKRAINVLALSGILVKRLAGGASPFSLSLWATTACWGWALKKLVGPDMWSKLSFLP